MPAIKTLTVRADGTVEFVYTDAMVGLLDHGEAHVRRASNVEPNTHGQWEADLSPVGGPTLGPFKLREDALRAEVEWLETYHL